MKKGVSVTLKGMAEVERRARQELGKLADDVVRELYEEAEAAMTVAKSRTPVLTGTLRSSGFVEPPKRGDREIVLGFGTFYGLWVHENLTARHTVGQAKFLESALLDAAPGLAARVGKRLGLVTKGE